MEYITTTNLRTQSTKLIEALKKGSSVKLIHRSKIIGVIEPEEEKEEIPFDAKAFKKIIKNLNLPKTTYSQREKIYREHLEEKYGKGVR